MLMRLLILSTFVFISFLSYSQKKQVCFTIDDLPVVSYWNTDAGFQQDITDKLLTSISNHRIPAIGFVNETKLYVNGNQDAFQISLLKSWLNHGLELGNHTFSHIDYNATTLAVYGSEILKGEKITRDLMTSKKKSLTYFRHPYLHTGNSREKSDSLNVFLKTHGYVVAPVTIDNDDYIFARAYQRAKSRNDASLATKVGRDYIDYMEKKVKYYEKLSQELFGRNVAHTLLLHANALNADYIGALAEMYERNNYEFITLEQALKDKAYQSEISRFGNWGISWIDRWALSAGKKGDFFKDEPATPEYIAQLAKAEQ
jgi:peptidoglycan/xylan/chitin deacetylase (PgdA/CDA1 family)